MITQGLIAWAKTQEKLPKEPHFLCYSFSHSEMVWTRIFSVENLKRHIKSVWPKVLATPPEAEPWCQKQWSSNRGGKNKPRSCDHMIRALSYIETVLCLCLVSRVICVPPIKCLLDQWHELPSRWVLLFIMTPSVFNSFPCMTQQYHTRGGIDKGFWEMTNTDWSTFMPRLVL